MKYIERLVPIIIISFFLFYGCSFNAKGKIIDATEEAPVEETTELTLMVYMAADNDLESEAIANLKQMEHSNFDKMNVLVLLDRAEEYDRTNGDWTDTRLFEVTHDSTSSNYIVSKRLNCPILGLSKDVETELDMANYNVLRNFIKFAKTEYEAEKYALIIWGHGTGWRYSSLDRNRAIAIDDKTNTYMSVLNEGKALKDIGLSVIGFDTCFGGVIENLYEIKDCSIYTVASPDITPSHGWNYSQLLEDLTQCDFTETEIARIMAESSSVSTSIYDNSKILNVYNKFELFSESLSNYIDSNETREEILNKLVSVKAYSYSQYPCDMFLDIHSMSEVFTSFSNVSVKQTAQSLQSALYETGSTTSSSKLLMGIYFIEKSSAQTFSTQHPSGYIKNQNDTSQCSFIKDSTWWVPTSTQNTNSLLDKLFYKVY